MVPVSIQSLPAHAQADEWAQVELDGLISSSSNCHSRAENVALLLQGALDLSSEPEIVATAEAYVEINNIGGASGHDVIISCDRDGDFSTMSIKYRGVVTVKDGSSSSAPTPSAIIRAIRSLWADSGEFQ